MAICIYSITSLLASCLIVRFCVVCTKWYIHHIYYHQYFGTSIHSYNTRHNKLYLCPVNSQFVGWLLKFKVSQLHTISHKKHASLFWTISPMFLEGFLHFLYQWKQEWIYSTEELQNLQLYPTVSPHYLIKLKLHKTAHLKSSQYFITQQQEWSPWAKWAAFSKLCSKCPLFALTQKIFYIPTGF